MLSMKTLKVAVVTMGSALLLGPGLASAIDLDMDASETNAPSTYALESLAAASEEPGVGVVTNAVTMRTTHYGLNNDQDFEIAVTSKIELTGTWFVRLELGGGLAFLDGDFTTPATSGSGSFNQSPSLSISAGDSVAIYRTSATISADEKVMFGLTDELAVPAAAGAYSATMTVHQNLNDALDGRGETPMNFFGGSGTVIRVVSGLDASVTAGDPLTASVDTGFLWFTNPGGGTTAPIRAHAMLGQFQAIADPTVGVFAANDGMQALDVDIIATGPTAVGVTVAGDLTIGAFEVIGPFMEDDVNTADMDEAAMSMACTAPSKDPIEDPMDYAMGNLANPDDAEADVTDMGVAARAAGIYGLCVNVDVAGAGTNMTPIPAGTYEATVMVTGPGTDAKAAEAASDMIGSIRRDGASVQIAYLTTSVKHNQRLIVVNRGTRPIMITDIQFQSEAGTEVELSALALAAAGTPAAMIPGGETRVIRVGGDLGMLNITGDSRRTAATLSFNGVNTNISVATTQVNLEDSSTDTVMWTVK